MTSNFNNWNDDRKNKAIKSISKTVSKWKLEYINVFNEIHEENKIMNAKELSQKTFSEIFKIMSIKSDNKIDISNMAIAVILRSNLFQGDAIEAYKNLARNGIKISSTFVVENFSTPVEKPENLRTLVLPKGTKFNDGKMTGYREFSDLPKFGELFIQTNDYYELKMPDVIKFDGFTNRLFAINFVKKLPTNIFGEKIADILGKKIIQRLPEHTR